MGAGGGDAPPSGRCGALGIGSAGRLKANIHREIQGALLFYGGP